MKKLILAVLLAVVIVPMASATDIDILFLGGSWAWAGGVGSQLFIGSTTTQLNGIPVAVPISIQSGGAIGGNGSLLNPFTWAAGGSIVFGPGLCTAGADCFDGTFTNLQAGYNGSGGLTFVGSFLAGSFDPAFLALLGLSPNPYTGLIHIDVSPTATFALGSGRNPDGSVFVGTVGSGDMHLTPTAVPEPGTLAMFGSGLIGIAGVLRRKLSL